MKYRHRLLFLLFSLSMITFLDRVCISVAGPQIQHDLNISAEQWGWILGAFSLAYAAFEIPTGMMGDRVGPRRVLTRIVLWWSAFTALTGAAVSYPIMLVTRFCFGIGEAGAFPNISASISRWFPAVERARAQGWIWTATRVGSALSPVLVVPIQIYFGWRVTFWIFGGIGVVWTVVWLWWYRDDPSAKRGVTQSELDEIGVQKTVTRHQVDWRTAFRSPEVRTIMLMYFCYCYAAYFFISWLHTFLVKGRGFSPQDLAFFSPLPFVFGAFSNLGGGYVSDILVRRLGLKWGRRLPGVIGLTLSGVSVLAGALLPGKYTAIVFLTCAYASSDFMMPSAWAVCLDIGKKYSGTVSGAMNTAGQFGSFISAVIFGYLVQALHSYSLPLIPIGVMLLISASQWLRIDPTRELVTNDIAAETALSK